MSLRVSVILDRKGTDVFTIPADAMFLAVADALAEHRVGALVVCSDQGPIEGIVSERDIVAQLARFGTGATKRSVREFMSTQVTTCRRDTTLDELMALMTQHRIRHVPVVTDEGLGGLISIGDVVKLRLDELEVQKQSLEQYVTEQT